MGGNRALAVYRDNGHLYYLLVLTLRYFYRKQAALRLSEQAHGTQLALFLRLQRAFLMWKRYMRRCSRLFSAALTARAACVAIPAMPKRPLTLLAMLCFFTIYAIICLFYANFA